MDDDDDEKGENGRGKYGCRNELKYVLIFAAINPWLS
jgi:hypothetical protein